MNYRYATILPSKTVSTDGVETIDINIKQPISRIDILYNVTKGTGYTMAYPAAHDISKIELVSGSDVLHSLNGSENQALCLYDRRCPTMSHGQHLQSCSEVSLFGLDFGRKLWDTELAFDPTRFNNPQLKITHTKAVADTTGSAAALEVMAHIFDEKVISPIGFLMSKEIHSESTPANDSFKYVDLPLDYPIRKMLVRAYYADTEPWATIEGVRLDEDHERRIPLDVLTEAYFRTMKGVWAPVVTQSQFGASESGITYYVIPTDYYVSFAGGGVGGLYGATLTAWGTGGKIIIQCSGSSQVEGIIMGYLPHHCFEFPFGIQDDMADWYDVTKVGSLRLRVRGGGTGTSGTYQVILQQLRRY